MNPVVSAAAIFLVASACTACQTTSDPSRFDLESSDTSPVGPGDSGADSSSDGAPTMPDGGATEQPDAFDAAPDSETPAPDPDAAAPDIESPVDVSPTDVAPVLPDVDTSNVITIGTWNVRRLFDTVCDSGACGDDAFETAYSQAQFEFRISQAVSGIQRLGADVVLLQEVENSDALDALAAALNGSYDVHILGETDFDASLDTAVLSRGELIQVTRHRNARIPRPSGGTTTFAREFLEVEVNVRGTRLIVFNAHFKSQNDDDADRRLAEARAAAEIARARIAERPDATVILGGDLNDVPGSDAISALDAVTTLSRVAAELGADAGTVEFNGLSNALDHLYVCTTCPWVYVPGTAAVVRSSGSSALSGSDHAGLRASIQARGTR